MSATDSKQGDDPLAIAALLEASLRLWDVDAACRLDPGDHSVLLISRDGAAWGSLRRDAGPRSESRPGFESGPSPICWRLDLEDGLALEFRSLRPLLRAIRQELDSEFVPGRAIVGIRPTAQSRAT